MVSCGLLVRIEALPGKESEVEEFLLGGLALVLEEPETTAWYAVRIAPSTFAIFDAFPGEEGRDAHLNGKVAAALMASVGELIEAPTLEKVDVLAVKA